MTCTEMMARLMRVDWGSVPDWIEALAVVATAIIAVIALRTWRTPVHGTTRHNAAAEILEQARLFRYLFYDARNPMYWAGEFPPGYHEKKREEQNARQRYGVDADLGSETEADGFAYVFNARWKLLEPQMLQLARLRARAGAVLSEDVAKAIEDLARKGRELDNYMREMVEQYRVGPGIVRQWSDQRWVERVKASVTVDDTTNPQDPYSLEFEEKFNALAALLRPDVEGKRTRRRG